MELGGGVGRLVRCRQGEMITKLDDIRMKKAEIERLASKHGAYDVRIFGSVSHGQATETSDVDVLVKAGPHTSPWFPVELKLELEALLDCNVDVATEDRLYWLLRRRILKEAVPV